MVQRLRGRKGDRDGLADPELDGTGAGQDLGGRRAARGPVCQRQKCTVIGSSNMTKKFQKTPYTTSATAHSLFWSLPPVTAETSIASQPTSASRSDRGFH